MLEIFLEKYDNRYEISRDSIYYKKKSEIDLKNKNFLTCILKPKPFLDGAIFGSVLGLGLSLVSNDDSLSSIYVGAVSFSLINQQQYYFMMFMDYYFDIFSIIKNKKF